MGCAHEEGRQKVFIVLSMAREKFFFSCFLARARGSVIMMECYSSFLSVIEFFAVFISNAKRRQKILELLGGYWRSTRSFEWISDSKLEELEQEKDFFFSWLTNWEVQQESGSSLVFIKAMNSFRQKLSWKLKQKLLWKLISPREFSRTIQLCSTLMVETAPAIEFSSPSSFLLSSIFRKQLTSCREHVIKDSFVGVAFNFSYFISHIYDVFCFLFSTF